MTVPQLKERLRQENLPVSGRKQDLISRLRGRKLGVRAQKSSSTLSESLPGKTVKKTTESKVGKSAAKAEASPQASAAIPGAKADTCASKIQPAKASTITGQLSAAPSHESGNTNPTRVITARHAVIEIVACKS